MFIFPAKDMKLQYCFLLAESRQLLIANRQQPVANSNRQSPSLPNHHHLMIQHRTNFKTAPPIVNS
jgi:hypothetical protein